MNGTYGESFLGGIQQNLGGYFTLNVYNAGTSKIYIMGVQNILYIYTDIHLNGLYSIAVNNGTMTPTIHISSKL